MQPERKCGAVFPGAGRLRERQAEEAAAATAYATLAPGLDPSATASRLEAVGYGRRTRATAADVLARLRKKTIEQPATA